MNLSLPPRPVLIAGGAGVAALLAFLWWRSRSPDDDDLGADAFGGSTLLFTPPPALAAPGAGDWSSGAATVTGGTTTLQPSVTEAIQQQDENAVKLGQSALLSSLAERVVSTLPKGNAARDFSFTANLAPGTDGNFVFTSSLDVADAPVRQPRPRPQPAAQQPRRQPVDESGWRRPSPSRPLTPAERRQRRNALQDRYRDVRDRYRDRTRRATRGRR